MDLNAAVDALSWRRVFALISGLSADSRWANAVHSTPQKVSGRAADAYLLNLVTKR